MVAGKFSDFYKAFKIKILTVLQQQTTFNIKIRVFNVKKYLFDKKINIRKPELIDFKNFMIYNSYCKLCVYPLTAVNINSYKGVCSACRVNRVINFLKIKKKV